MFADTIAAVATPAGVGAIGIVRLSGEMALPIARRLFAHAGTGFKSHRAYYGWLRDPRTAKPVDNVLLLYMQSPRSYTGEDIVEFHCHGGPTVLRYVLELCVLAGARLAERGEFSQRAFLNGKLDLAQAEAVIDLIQSRTSGSLHQAAYQLEGHLSLPIRQMRQSLLNLLVAIEANIDFPDEVDAMADELIASSVAEVQTGIARLLASAEVGRIWKEGVSVAIVGQPNVGKSTLLNRLLRYERAIVTEIPGTTRDTVEEAYNLHGIPIQIVDTAGLRDTADRVELMGIARSRAAMAAADIVLLVVDSTCGLQEQDQQLLAQVTGRPCLVIFNKMDLLEGQTITDSSALNHPFVLASAREAAGLEALEECLYQLITAGKNMEYKVSINHRHQQCLWRAQEALARVEYTVTQYLPADFAAIDLKEAVAALGEVVGEAVTEELIHEIFRQFCIGK